MRRRHTLAGLLACGLALASPSEAQRTSPSNNRPSASSGKVSVGGNPCRDTITFSGLPAGLIPTQVNARGGLGPVLIEGSNPFIGLGVPNAAVIFDSSNPTGGDADLGSPNQAFGGPGVGAGGGLGSPFANTVPLGKILILGENLNDGNNDGLVDDPDDANLAGSPGTLTFDFSSIGSVYIERISVIDVEVERPPSNLDFYGPGNTFITNIVLPQPGNNGVVNAFFLGVNNVEKMVINLNGSGGYDNIVFECFTDCNGNGVQDSVDIAAGTSQDCDQDGVPDECQLDCDGNGIPDTCDIAGGASDCDGNGVPDVCQPDCDGDGLIDACEPDCDGDGTPDDCDTEPDCDGNGVPDNCDILGGTPDCDFDGTPDVCEPDSDGDGIPDDCEDCPLAASFCDVGCYELQDKITGTIAPPDYGLRLDGLFGDYPNNYTFSFEEPGAGGLMCYDGAGTITINGIAYGGLDTGSAWDPVVQGFLTVDFVYTGAVCDGSNLVVPDSGNGYGQVTWLNTGETIQLFPKSDGSDFARVSASNGRLEGWLNMSTGMDGTQDFAATLVAVSECPGDPDCDGDGIPDALEDDCDMDGVPDDCESDCDADGIPDDCESEYCATDGLEHSIWINGDSYSFAPLGSFVENPDGTASLTGIALRQTNNNQGFYVDIQFSDRVVFGDANFPPTGSPKDPIGSPDVDSWTYYETTTGTLTGILGYEGGLVSVTRRGEAFQVGDGANHKDADFGASGWLTTTIVSQPDNAPFVFSTQGDINIDLSDCPSWAGSSPVTVPDHPAFPGEKIGALVPLECSNWSWSDSRFTWTSVRFIENPSSEGARFVGTLEHSSIAGTLQVDIGLFGRADPGDSNHPPTGSNPYLSGFSDLPNGYLSSNGGPVNPSSWHYYLEGTGIVTGTGAFEGLTMVWELDEPSLDVSAQVGAGASGRNVNPSFGAWFDSIVWSQPNDPTYCIPDTDQIVEVFINLPFCP